MSSPVARDRADRQHVAAKRLAQSAVYIVRAGQFAFCQHDDLRPRAEFGRVLLEFAANHMIVGDRIAAIGRHRFDEMDEDPRPLDMAEEFMPQADAGMRPFDQPGQVGHDE